MSQAEFTRRLGIAAALAILALFVVLVIFADPEPDPVVPVVHREALPSHVQQVQPDYFIVPTEHAGELNGVCRNPDDPDWTWSELDRGPKWTEVSCTLPQRFPKQMD